MPVMPVNAAGWRMDPPVSVPVAQGAIRAETADAEPPDEPPGQCFLFQGLVDGPYALLSLVEPIANSSILSLPNVTMPA